MEVIGFDLVLTNFSMSSSFCNMSLGLWFAGVEHGDMVVDVEGEGYANSRRQARSDEGRILNLD
jgi:hypothetical protein